MPNSQESFSINRNPVCFHELPDIAQIAAKEYYLVDAGFSEEDLYKNGWYHGIASTNVLMELAAINEGFNSADEYHAWYCAEGDVPDHGDSIWPVLLHGNEVLWDGWHRFHSYYKKGIEFIPFYATHDVSVLFSPLVDENQDDHSPHYGPR